MKITRLREETKAIRLLELDFVLDSMKTETNRKLVQPLREDIPYLGENVKSISAAKIPLILFGASWKKENEATRMVSYNGLVLLTVSHLIDEREATTVRDKAAESLQTRAAFVGSSRRSVKIVVPFTLPDGTLPMDNASIRLFHVHACLRAGAYYEAQLGWKVDWKEGVIPGPEQACRLSYDPDLYNNPDALPIRIEQPTRMPEPTGVREASPREEDPLRRMLPGYDRHRRISLLYETCLTDTYQRMGNGAEEGKRKAFLVHLAGNCLRSAIPEEDAVRFALFHPFDKSLELEIRVTFANVYRKEKFFGTRPCLPKRMLVAIQVEEFMRRRYVVRYNRMWDCKEYRERHSLFVDFRPVTVEVVKSICFEAQLEGISAIEYDIQRYVDSDRVLRYWPIEEYLFGLPVWDGVDRIRELADWVPCDNVHWRDFFYTWFISMVAHWMGMDREHANSTSPLLIGSQGCRKSTFCRELLPRELQGYYTDSIDLSNRKDTELALGRFALINLDEFDSIPVTKQPYLKNLLQRPRLNIRKPYGTGMEEIRRFASFIATSNTLGVLTDLTGSRRFIGIEVKGQIRIEPVDHPLLYAQAVAVLRAGERYWFTPEEELRLNLDNRVFEKRSLLEELFLYYYRLPEKNEACQPISAPDILLRISKMSKMDITDTRLELFGKLMQKYDIRKKCASDRKYYYVVPVER